MAPSTRNTDHPSTPSRRTKGSEADTPKKSAFFREVDKPKACQSIRSIAHDFDVSHSTALRWLHDREINGSPAFRHKRRRSDKLGRRSAVSAETCKMLVSPSNPVRIQSYEAQIEYHNIPIKKRALRTQLAKNTNKGQKYKMAYIGKDLSEKNLKERVEYGTEHLDDDIDGFWQYIIFSDEAHYDPSSIVQNEVLREEGHRYDPPNIQQRGGKTGVALYFAAWINWHAKAEQLEFYNDENTYTEKPKRPPKPRKTMYESLEDYNTRVLQWEAAKPHDKDVKPKGNAMTQLYYIKRLLPSYITAIQKLRVYGPGNPGNWLFQEDGDPSHGMRKPGLARKLKDSNWIANLKHPAQSPDLNPKEGIWNIIKQRTRRRIYHSTEELKAILQEEWSKVTMEEIRERIADMPRRCRLLVETGGAPIKSAQ
jgi:transposase